MAITPRVVGSPILALDGGVRGGGMVVTVLSDGVVVDSLALTAFPSSGTLAMMLWPEGPRLEAGTPAVFDGWGPTRSHVFWRQMQSVSVTLQFALQSNTLGDAAAPYAWVVNYDLAPQTWTHVTLTWDTVANVAALYINRMEASRSAIIPPFAPTGQVVRIGGMPGRYDEVRLYDRVLSKEEVAALP